MIFRPSLNSFPTRRIRLLKLPPTLFRLLALPVLSLTVLVCLAAALSAVPGESVGGTLELGGSTGPDLALQVPESVGDWVLVPSEVNERQALLTVKARIGWILTVSPSANDGRMAQFDPGISKYTDQGRRLSKPMTIFSSGCSENPYSWKVVLPESGAIHQGDVAEGQQVVVALQQPVTWEDEALSEGQVYRIDLTFTLSPSG